MLTEFINIFLVVSLISENAQEEENLPSMDALEISKGNKGGIKSIPSYFGGEDDDDIPDMENFEDSDNIFESDPVMFLCIFNLFLPEKKNRREKKIIFCNFMVFFRK